MIKDWPYKKVLLFLIMGGFFLANALLAEFVGVKIFSFEKTFGFEPVQIKIFDFDPFSFNLTQGVVLWPVVFILTDLINEYYGKRGVKLFSFLAAAIILYAFFMIYLSIGSVPADFWIERKISDEEVIDMQKAFAAIFGQGQWIIIGSLVAFLIGQFVDVFVFQAIKRITKERFIWLRATGSTLVSQFIDSFVVLFIAFYIGAGWELKLVLAIGLVNYIYKFFAAVVLTPLVYLGHFLIERYLGAELAKEMKEEALNG